MTDIGIRVAVEGGSAAAGELDKVTDSTEKMGRAAKTHSSTVDDLKGAFGALGLTLGAAQVLGAVKTWTLEADRLADTLQTLGDRNVALASSMTLGAVTQMEAAAARSRMLTAGLDLTNEQFEALTVASAAYAQGAGKEANEVLGQLTQGLITGRTRGLEPLIGSFDEGASKATVTAEAIRRLTAASSDNRAQLAANAGTLDYLGMGWTSVKEKLGATYLAMLDAPFSTILPAIKDMTRALNGDMGLGDAALDVTRRFAELNAVVPGAGGALAGFIADALGASHAADAAADSAARLANRLARLARGAGRGFNMEEDVESAAGAAEEAAGAGFYNQQRRGRDAAVSRDLGDPTTVGTGERLIDTSYGPGQAARRGGGGGGGGRREPSSDMTFTVEEAEGFGRNAPGGTGDYAGAGYTTPLGGSSSNRSGRLPGVNPAGEARALGSRGFMPTRESAQNLAAIARNADRTADSLSKMGEIGSMALGALTGAVESNVAAWVSGEQSIGAALAGILRATLTTIATESTVKAVFYGAEALAMAVIQNWPAAAAAAGASAQYAATALLAGGGALAMSAASSSGGRSSSRGSSARSNGGAVRDAGGGGNTIVHNYVLSKGSTVITESARTFSEHIQRAGRSNARRRGQRVPVPAM